MQGAEATGEVEAVTIRQRFYFGGVFQERQVRAAEICGGANRVVSVRSETDWPTALWTALTMYIYNPATATVLCRRPSAAR